MSLINQKTQNYQLLQNATNSPETMPKINDSDIQKMRENNHTFTDKKVQDLYDKIFNILQGSRGESLQIELGQNKAPFTASIAPDGTIILKDNQTKEIVTINYNGYIDGSDELINSIVRSAARQGADPKSSSLQNLGTDEWKPVPDNNYIA